MFTLGESVTRIAMLQSDRERIFEALMYGIPRDGSALEREMSDLVTHDIDLIEPIIDEITLPAPLRWFRDRWLWLKWFTWN